MLVGEKSAVVVLMRVRPTVTTVGLVMAMFSRGGLFCGGKSMLVGGLWRLLAVGGCVGTGGLLFLHWGREVVIRSWSVEETLTTGGLAAVRWCEA